jgi:probable F420-dependent oxidoreductase
VRFAVTYPMVAGPYDPRLVSGPGMARFCQAAERSGFDGIGFTDHPAPSTRWLHAGGHDALDPFAALAFCAGVTTRLRLITNIAVLPYRHPLIVAKAGATLDALSGGRFVLAVGTGYLRGEYRALGVDFERRNALFDEALAVVRAVWAADDFSYRGITGDAAGQTAHPRPDPPPPVWIGGNSRTARRRVARFGDGWSAFPAPPVLARTARTPPLETVGDLAPLLDELWAMLADAGRDPSAIDVAFHLPGAGPGQPGFSADAHLEALEALGHLGVTWAWVGVPGGSLDAAVDALGQFGQEVISVLDR